MDEWKQVLVLIVPLLMNWWEVRKLRKEVKLQHDVQDARIEAIEVRVSVVEELSGPVLR